jgi:5-hydroxyisourate hydrolase
MSNISTHILDTSLGRPASGVNVLLESADTKGNWTQLSQGTTDNDGRIAAMLKLGTELTAGDYRLRFATGDYFRGLGITVFYPEVVVHVRLDTAGGRFHLPLLLSPFGYSTYRGS